jgi:hypothetical protein
MDVADMSEMDLNELLQGATSAYIESQREKMLQTTASTSQPHSTNATSSSSSSEPSPSPPRKKSRRQITLSEFMEFYGTIVQNISPVNYQSLLSQSSNQTTDSLDDSNNTSTSVSRSPSYLEHLINTIGHPSILKIIAQQFLKNVTQNPPRS